MQQKQQYTTQEGTMAVKLFKGAEYLITAANKDDVFTPEDFSAEQR